MRKFRFSLRRLERLRHAVRLEAEGRLVAALVEADGAAKAVKLSEERREDAAQDWREPQPGELLDSDEVRARATSLHYARDTLARAEATEREARRKAENAQDDYADKRRSQQVIERLHERRRRRWSEAMHREEQGQLDELHRLGSRVGQREGREE